MLERPGQGHTCRSAHSAPQGPPLGWHVATWVTVGLLVLLAACSLAVAMTRLGLPAPGEPTPRTDEAIVHGLLSLVWFGLLVGVLVALVVFSRGTRRVADRFSDQWRWYPRPRLVLRLYGLVAIVTIVAQVFAGAGWRQVLVAATVVRFVGILLLIGAVLMAWARIRGLASDSAAQTYAAAADPPPVSRYAWDDEIPAPRSEPEPPARPAAPIVEQPRGLAPHRAPLNAVASDADWNPHHWEPES
ncbi:hypothetical protein JIG36_38980 [Actinoplanes sp. LDG1-06]|uniref:DUF2975 domain-containing protein n=1 Tax=Paractinoplanes ovalisporus TaxID=2810368 RepID=A0ABS2ANT7_9ACTN|nr:hypothetical protein [Actinoplanes ovalisporus]MBM2621506.1 hypothetical protein [Actinoplanes ovalisporus]